MSRADEAKHVKVVSRGRREAKGVKGHRGRGCEAREDPVSSLKMKRVDEGRRLKTTYTRQLFSDKKADGKRTRKTSDVQLPVLLHHQKR